MSATLPAGHPHADPLGTAIYRAGHSPCQHFARIAYDALAAEIGDAQWSDPADPWPGDDVEDDAPGSQRRWTERRVLAAIVGDDPPKLPPQVAGALGGLIRSDLPASPRAKASAAADKRAAKAAEATAADPWAKEPPYTLAGRRIDWPAALPELKVWAGNATLATLCDGRRAALHAVARPAGVRLLDWSVPYPTMSGLDARTAATTLDIGFSPAALGMAVACYAAAELLAVVGMQIDPITRYGRWEYGYRDPDGRAWRYSVVERTDYHRMLTMSRPALDV